jgi:hypothetical protein
LKNRAVSGDNMPWVLPIRENQQKKTNICHRDTETQRFTEKNKQIFLG